MSLFISVKKKIIYTKGKNYENEKPEFEWCQILLKIFVVYYIHVSDYKYSMCVIKFFVINK
jgi:hypothetical protein